MGVAEVGGWGGGEEGPALPGALEQVLVVVSPGLGFLPHVSAPRTGRSQVPYSDQSSAIVPAGPAPPPQRERPAAPTAPPFPSPRGLLGGLALQAALGAGECDMPGPLLQGLMGIWGPRCPRGGHWGGAAGAPGPGSADLGLGRGPVGPQGAYQSAQPLSREKIKNKIVEQVHFDGWMAQQ